MKRAIQFKLKNGEVREFEITKATAIRSDVGMFHLDKISSGWRLTFSSDFADKFADVDKIEIIRED